MTKSIVWRMLKQARYLPILWCICCTEDAPLVQRYVRYPKKKRLLNPFVTVNVTIILHFVKFNKIKYLNIWILPNTSILSEEIPSTELSSTIFYPFATRLYFCKRWCNTPMSFYSLSVLSSFLLPSSISICNYCPEAIHYTLWCSVIRVTSETGIAEREKVVRIFSETILWILLLARNHQFLVHCINLCLHHREFVNRYLVITNIMHDHPILFYGSAEVHNCSFCKIMSYYSLIDTANYRCCQ